jgi:hypothetical protein
MDLMFPNYYKKNTLTNRFSHQTFKSDKFIYITMGEQPKKKKKSKYDPLNSDEIKEAPIKKKESIYGPFKASEIEAVYEKPKKKVNKKYAEPWLDEEKKRIDKHDKSKEKYYDKYYDKDYDTYYEGEIPD